MTKNEERDLDAALRGAHVDDQETSSLAHVARELERVLAVEAPTAPRERAMFVHGVAASGHRSLGAMRLAVPAFALVLLGTLIGVAGRGALPGDALYPVREVLLEVGLAPPAAQLVDARIDSADRLLDRARAQPEQRMGEAHRLALRAIGALASARRLAEELDAPARATTLKNVRVLETAASDVIVEAASPGGLASPSPSGDPNDDSSGPGSGSDDPGDDSSGSGSGGDDSGDDSSGSGSGGDDSGGSG